MSGDESAFPSYRQIANDGISLTEAVQLGISKREYFAAKALCGLLSSITHPTCDEINQLAINARIAADSLIAELNKP